MYGLAPSGVLQAKAAGMTLAKVVVLVVFCPSPLKSQKLSNPTTAINPSFVISVLYQFAGLLFSPDGNHGVSCLCLVHIL